jgi:hypothetical protein
MGVFMFFPHRDDVSSNRVFLSHLSFRKERCPKKALKLFLLLGRKSFRIKKKKLHASPVRVQRTAGSAAWLCKSKREKGPKRAWEVSALSVQREIAPCGALVSAGR